MSCIKEKDNELCDECDGEDYGCPSYKESKDNYTIRCLKDLIKYIREASIEELMEAFPDEEHKSKNDKRKDFIEGERLYYLCDTRSITGNCLMFWRKEGKGYTYNLDDCDVFTESEAMSKHRNRISDVPYPKDVIDSLAERHIDHQDLDNYIAKQNKKGE